MPYEKRQLRVVPMAQPEQGPLFNRALASMCGTALFIGLVIAAVWLAWGAR